MAHLPHLYKRHWVSRLRSLRLELVRKSVMWIRPYLSLVICSLRVPSRAIDVKISYDDVVTGIRIKSSRKKIPPE